MKPFIIPIIVILAIYSAYKFGRYEMQQEMDLKVKMSYILGRQSLQKEIEQRAKTTNDIEVIIFGEKQL